MSFFCLLRSTALVVVGTALPFGGVPDGHMMDDGRIRALTTIQGLGSTICGHCVWMDDGA